MVPIEAHDCDTAAVLPALGDLNLDSLDAATLEAVITGLSRLYAYAGNRAEALACRAAGNLTRAEAFEAACANIYPLVPENWRWPKP